MDEAGIGPAAAAELEGSGISGADPPKEAFPAIVEVAPNEAFGTTATEVELSVPGTPACFSPEEVMPTILRYRPTEVAVPAIPSAAAAATASGAPSRVLARCLPTPHRTVRPRHPAGCGRKGHLMDVVPSCCSIAFSSSKRRCSICRALANWLREVLSPNAINSAISA